LRHVSSSLQNNARFLILYYVFSPHHKKGKLTEKSFRGKICDDIFACTTIAAFQCRCVDQDHEWATPSGLPAVLLSIRLLIDSLIVAAADFDESIDSFTKHHRFPLCRELEGVPPSTSILLNHMVKHDWCLHQARWFCERFTFNVVYYLASVRRKPSVTSHKDCEREDHCVANNTDPKTYQCRHTNAGCSCQYISVSIEEVKAIIRDGEIPLISFTETPSGVIQHKVIRAKYSTKYTAISHLWSDGLGNPRQNSLPKCQIINLIEQIREANHRKRLSKGEPRERWRRVATKLVSVYHKNNYLNDYPKIVSDSVLSRNGKHRGVIALLLFSPHLLP
jgi:hypothetical protein